MHILAWAPCALGALGQLAIVFMRKDGTAYSLNTIKEKTTRPSEQVRNLFGSHRGRGKKINTHTHTQPKHSPTYTYTHDAHKCSFILAWYRHLNGNWWT